MRDLGRTYLFLIRVLNKVKQQNNSKSLVFIVVGLLVIGGCPYLRCTAHGQLQSHILGNKQSALYGHNQEVHDLESLNRCRHIT